MISQLILNIISNPICRILLLYTTCILAHYAASHMYIYFCVPLSFLGLFMSPFMALTPHCQAFRWIIYNGGLIITMMWFLIGNWFLNKFQEQFFKKKCTNKLFSSEKEEEK